MTIFLRLLAEKDKAQALTRACKAFRTDQHEAHTFQVDGESFRAVPGAPFAYWVSDAVRDAFQQFSPFDGAERIARVTNQTGDDNRYIRAWWEICERTGGQDEYWKYHAKGGAFSPFYCDVHLVVRWDVARQTYHGFIGTEHRPLEKPACLGSRLN